MRYCMMVFRGTDGRLPGAEQLRRAGFVLSAAAEGGDGPQGATVAVPGSRSGRIPRELPPGGGGAVRAHGVVDEATLGALDQAPAFVPERTGIRDEMRRS